LAEHTEIPPAAGPGSTCSVRCRRAMMLLASAGGNRVPVIAQLVQADEDTARDVIHRLNEKALACPGPQRAGGRPRQLSPGNEDFVIPTAATRPAPAGPCVKPTGGSSIRIGRET
jgi:transposase